MTGSKTLGLLGKKLGMTQIFLADGTCVPVTVIQAGPCKVMAVKMATAAELVPLIDAETARRAADKTTIAVKKPRAPAKKKVVPATGHQTALPDSKAA